MDHKLQALLGPVVDTLFPPDPGSFRLIGAARATLSGLLGLALCAALQVAWPLPFTARVLAFSTALFLSVAARDPSPRQLAVTFAVAPVPLFATSALVALALTVPAMPAVLTLLVVFASVAASSCGPRWGALGAVSLVTLIVSLLAEVKIGQLPGWLAVLVLAALAAALVQFVVLPDRPTARVARLGRAIRRGMDAVFACVEAAVRHGGWTAQGRRRLRRATQRLNEAVMLAHRYVPASHRLHLLECELVAERVARVALMHPRPGADRQAVLTQLANLRHHVRAGTAPEVPPPQATPLGGVLAGMAVILGSPERAEVGTALDPAPPPPARPWATLQLRPAFQAALAAMLAILGGSLISSQRWYYAVFAAVALFQGTRSRGESIGRALEMLFGTLAGVAVGMALSVLLNGQTVAEFVLSLAGVFLAFFASTAAYAVMAFWLTVILGLVFGLLGYFPRALLLLRLEEVLVGAASGVLVATIVLVQPTQSLVRRSAAAFLAALGPVLRDAVRPLCNQPVSLRLAELTVTLEQRYQALRQAATARLSGLRTERLDRGLLLLGACDEWARELVRISLHLPPQPDPVIESIVSAATARIDTSLAALGATLTGHHAPAPTAETEPGSPPSTPDGDDAAVRATRLLLRLDSALLHVRQRLMA